MWDYARICSGLTRLVRAGYSRHDSEARRERARIMWRVQDGGGHMQRSLPSSSISRPVDFNTEMEINGC